LQEQSAVGDVVLIIELNTPCSQAQLGRIGELLCSEDAVSCISCCLAGSPG
ncbi:hypothetical protein T03_1384, partial [Trichinella britovi]